MKFNSFFMGGFECADEINRSGQRINLLKETEHDIRVDEDYKLLNELGINVAREGICWSVAETSPYKFDFSYLNPFYKAAEKYGFQIIWDLCHFGYPDGLIPTHPQFVTRFEALCEEFAKYHSSMSDAPLMVAPINEISFLSWHSGDMRGTVPFAIHSGNDIKYHLCMAAIRGIKRLKQILPNCVIFGVEPLIKIHAADDSISLEHLNEINENQYKSIDILLGMSDPELGGSPDLLDVIGFNYYYNNQWDHHHVMMSWPETERPVTPFSEMLKTAYLRYNKPVVLTETGHFGYGRDLWIKHITEECLRAKALGVDLRGICIYPVVDRPDWDDLTDYSKCGIWDLDEYKNRIPDNGYVAACNNAIEMVKVSGLF
ncbi:Beta-glucosidase/6-phospho-beta-glucosidase/beta-galactosidase [Flavobacteriaceae bacterium MAR_2010_188]|nr:Beta-glucosidase/6-phospho-beta-glucosidase/beta-galactosidase [Flavobacteriaceae bacterium MAR_2010_188]